MTLMKQRSTSHPTKTRSPAPQLVPPKRTHSRNIVSFIVGAGATLGVLYALGLLHARCGATTPAATAAWDAIDYSRPEKITSTALRRASPPVAAAAASAFTATAAAAAATAPPASRSACSAALSCGRGPLVDAVGKVAPCSLGDPGWSCEAIARELPGFIAAYAKRPWLNSKNGGGTGMQHQFALWTIIRLLKPKHIIESGTWMGGGSWLMRQACPTCQMNYVDPKKTRVSWQKAWFIDDHADSIFRTGDEFQDFAAIDWDAQKGLDKERTLVFFDDHQAATRRIAEARALGFRHIVFDDNYAPATGDNFSVKKACDAEGALWSASGASPTHEDNALNAGSGKDTTKVALTTVGMARYAAALRAAAEIVFEFPPLVASMCERNTHVTEGKISAALCHRITKPALLGTDLAELESCVTQFGAKDDISRLEQLVDGYNWIVYVKLRR